MEDLIRIITDNGLGIASFLFLIFYVYTDKKQVAEEKKANSEFIKSMVTSLDNNTDTLKVVSENQKEMTNTLEKLNDRIDVIEKKIDRKED